MGGFGIITFFLELDLKVKCDENQVLQMHHEEKALELEHLTQLVVELTKSKERPNEQLAILMNHNEWLSSQLAPQDYFSTSFTKGQEEIEQNDESQMEVHGGLDLGVNDENQIATANEALIGRLKWTAEEEQALRAKNPSARIEHEASTSKIGEDQHFYLPQRRIEYECAMASMISGFCRDVFNELPEEFGAEVNQLMGLKLDSVG